MNDFKAVVAMFFFVFAVTWLALLGIARGAEPACGREFTWERGPIRREIARIANSQKEEEEAFERRIHRYSWAVSDARDRYWQRSGFTKHQLSALLLTIGKHESHFDRQVCEDFSEEAPGKPALGCWQTELRREAESVEDFAFLAAQDLVRARRYCVARGFDPIAGAVSLYATGSVCDWDGAPERVATFKVIHFRLAGNK